MLLTVAGVRNLLFVCLFASACSRGPLSEATTGDAGAGGSIDPPCAALDETSCTQAADCVADYCTGCGCGRPTFAACRRHDDPPAKCAPLFCPIGICCRKPSDCAAMSQCVSPGVHVPACLCGAGDCQTDADCAGKGANQFCDTVSLCDCENQGGRCVTGCATVHDCADGESCGSDHRCSPPSCAGAPPSCPINFTCDEGQCIRNSCQDDADCPGAICVDGSCYLALGTCEPPGPG